MGGDLVNPEGRICRKREDGVQEAATTRTKVTCRNDVTAGFVCALARFKLFLVVISLPFA
jgi:hypothetical protein